MTEINQKTRAEKASSHNKHPVKSFHPTA